MLEDKITEQFVKLLLLPQVDQYGNQHETLLERGVQKFMQDNNDKLLAEVVKKLDVNIVATKIADRLQDTIKGVYGSSYDRQEILKDLKDKIANHLAKKIAEDLKI